MPDISPDWSAPGLSGLTQIASWILAIGLVLSVLALIISFIILAYKGFGNQGLQQFAGKAIGWVILAVILLGSFSGVWQFFYGFDLGF